MKSLIFKINPPSSSRFTYLKEYLIVEQDNYLTMVKDDTGGPYMFNNETLPIYFFTESEIRDKKINSILS